MGYISPDLAGFQPTNFTQVPLQPSSTHLWPKPHPPINKLKTATDLVWQLLFLTYLQRTLLHVTSQDECFMPSMDSYIQESITQAAFALLLE